MLSEKLKFAKMKYLKPYIKVMKLKLEKPLKTQDF